MSQRTFKCIWCGSDFDLDEVGGYEPETNDKICKGCIEVVSEDEEYFDSPQ